jgi:Protein of unknown function (DUF4050)
VFLCLGKTVARNANARPAHMIPLQVSSELCRFALVIGVLIFYRSIHKLVARIMDRVTSTSSKSAYNNTQIKSPNPSSGSTSPLMSSFHRRFRSSPSNSTPENTAVIESTDSAPGNKNEAARSAKRFLLSTVRDDWTFPPSERQLTLEDVYREPLDYRIREEGSSDPEALSDEPYDGRDPMAFTDSDPYKFETPDAVARTIVERKRKRRRLFREEVEWNEGLRTWIDRRNAWCGAVEQRPTRSKVVLLPKKAENDCAVPARNDLSMPMSPRSQISASSSSVRSLNDSEEDGEVEGPEEDQGPLLPIYPSLLPDDNSIRASIKPAMYPTIYSKVVLQSLTPTVPMRLPDMIGALIQGWKSEGNWPPRGVVPTASIIQEGGRRASELLKFRRRENAMAEKGRMRKGVGVVKRALGLRPSNGESNGEELKFENESSNRKSSHDQAGLVDEDALALC